MNRASARKWIFIAAVFAAINVVQVAGIILVLRQPRRILTVESFRLPGCVWREDVLSFHSSSDPFRLPDPLEEQDISVRFSHAMVTPEQIGKACPEGLITITPPVSGDPVWHDVRTLTFRPKEKLQRATRYTVAVSREIASLSGESLADLQPGRVEHVISNLETTPNGLTVELESEQAGLLVVTDTHYPGWQATVNGKEAPIYRVSCHYFWRDSCVFLLT